jgi:hypothetical protein
MFKSLLATILTVTVAIAIPHVAIAKTVHTYRKEFAICYDVSIKDNIAYLATGDGAMWMVECDDTDVGDIYRITFDTHNTKSAKDDSIICIKYINTIDNISNIFNK